jgi:hypothetical protein
MFILHLFSIKTAREPCLKHINYQTIINIDIHVRIYHVVAEITNYLFFKIELIVLDFKNLHILCLGAGDLTCLVRPHSLLNPNDFYTGPLKYTIKSLIKTKSQSDFLIFNFH